MNRKIMALGLSTLLIGGAAFGSFAATNDAAIQAELKEYARMELNGQQIILKDNEGNLLFPIAYEGELYMPIDQLGKEIGMQTYWEDDADILMMSQAKDPASIAYRPEEYDALDGWGYKLSIPSEMEGMIRPVVFTDDSLPNMIKDGRENEHLLSKTEVLYLPRESAPVEVIGSIEVYSKDGWEKTDQSGEVLAVRGDLVYVMQVTEENPFEKDSLDYRYFNQFQENFINNEFYLEISPAALNADGTEKTQHPLVGTWSDVNKGTEMKLTSDGYLYRSGQKVGSYLILDDSTVQLIVQGESSTIQYEIDGDELKWGPNLDQTFTKLQ